MGLNFPFSRGGRKKTSYPPPVPNPHRFEIVSAVQVGKALVAAVTYPDCTTFEGKKVIVFENMTKAELQSMWALDPHFAEGSKIIARVRPDQWVLALEIAELLR